MIDFLIDVESFLKFSFTSKLLRLCSLNLDTNVKFSVFNVVLCLSFRFCQN